MAVENGMSVTFLEEGGQSPEEVASLLVAFLGNAQATLDIAVYDCALSGALAESVGNAIRSAAGRGVAVRIAYYAGAHVNATVAPQSGSPEAFLEPLGVPVRPVRGFQSLMHDKYVIRDGETDTAAVWTGSTNWTADAWGREENLILQIPSPGLAQRYTSDFEELWSTGQVEGTGGDAGGAATVRYSGESLSTQVWFSPGGGVAMSHDVARSISSAQCRIVLASPVLTDGPILGALTDVLHSGRISVQGVYDRTQMEEAMRQWQSTDSARWKVTAFQFLAQAAHLSGKRSTPYAAGSVHDYMHVKIIVIDDTVYAGSYNFSHSGEQNAENLLRFESHDLAETCATYIDRIAARYAGSG